MLKPHFGQSHTIQSIRMLLVSFVMLFALSVHANTPTPQQIEMFKSLPKSQQEALLKQQGVDPKSFDISSLSGGSQNKPEPFVDSVKRLPATQTEQAEPVAFDLEKALAEQNNQQVPSADIKPLERFGANLFAGQPTTFAPVNDIPIPTDYLLGPGDQLNIQFYGTRNENYKPVIDRNGSISLPDIGPMSLAGQSLADVRTELDKRARTLGMGVRVNVTLGELRSFRIFVLGESRVPGSYLVSGMASITHALYVSGGISDIGSYRNIQLKRNGELIATLDLYDLLLKGDTSNDVRLQPGDSVFIPSVKNQVTLDGAVMRPAIYELKNEKTVKDVMALAGGFKPSAFLTASQLVRQVPQGYRQLVELNLADAQGLNLAIQNGDVINVAEIRSQSENHVKVQGEVYQAEPFPWRKGLKLVDVLPDLERFKPRADIDYILIKRQARIGGHFEVLAANWLQAYQHPLSAANIELHNRDELYVLPKDSEALRKEALEKINQSLMNQARHDQPFALVSAVGMVRFGGQYPLTKGMRIKDLVTASGGLRVQAMLNKADLISYQIVNGEKREIERLEIDLNKVLANDAQHNIELKPFDELIVKQVSEWSDATLRVTLEGEVRYPGTYTIAPGEPLKSVLDRAGGFTELADPSSSVFMREALKEQEKRELENLADELEKNLLLAMKGDAGLMRGDASGSMLTLGQSLIARIRQTPALGRLVIGLDSAQSNRYLATINMELRDGDRLVVPKKSFEVVVTGEVSRSASFIYQPGKSLKDYLAMSGGATKRADTESVFVVRGDGSIQQVALGWFNSGAGVEVNAGDTIVVPMDVERINPLITWTNVSSILSNFAVTAATLKTVGIIQ